MADQEERTWHWRNTQKTVRFFRFDARAGLVILLCLIHFRKWTLTLAISVNVIFWILERKGLSLPAAMRALRVWFVGSKRPAWIWTARRAIEDTGSR